MESIGARDDESVTTTDVERQAASTSLRKWIVVGVGVAVTLAPLLVMQTRPTGFHVVAEDSLIGFATGGCTEATQNCMGTKCCKAPRHKCFLKNQWWADCRTKCDKNYQDAWDKAHGITDGWDCQVLTNPNYNKKQKANHHPKKSKPSLHVLSFDIHLHQPKKSNDNTPETCSANGEDCREDLACCEAGSICYVKHETFSTCKQDCTPGKEWSCQVHGLMFLNETTLPEGANALVQMSACMSEGGCLLAKDPEVCRTKKCQYYVNLIKDQAEKAK